MKRSISALALCFSLLVLLSLFLYPPHRAAAAKESVLIKLLDLPAPPPPNPLVSARRRERDQKFYDINNPPRDDAPIEDLIDYWTNQTGAYRADGFVINFKSHPSGRSLDRLLAEMAKKPELASQLIGVLPDDKSAVDSVKELYETTGTESGADREMRKELREWLRFNSPYFSRDLEHVSQQIKDENNYVSQNNEDNLLALTRYDFDKASPIVSQLYNDPSQPVSRVLATWALYRHALETDALSDIERYRSELMRMVQDRNLPDGVRDKANDALMLERDFPGRDDWAFSLFEDETLVAITRYTMLTTLIRRSPPEKYAPRMITLVQKTSNPTVRAAAVRNLVIALNSNPGSELEIEIIKTLLPCLEDAKWAPDANDSRAALIRKLSQYQIPESVPGLIKLLDEQQTRREPVYGANMAANVMRAYKPANITAPASANLANLKINVGPLVSFYPYREVTVAALAKQKDARAVPALRRVLYEINGYERVTVVKAILDCGGFSIAEQMASLERVAKRPAEMAAGMAVGIASNMAANLAPLANTLPRGYSPPYIVPRPAKVITEPEIKDLLGQQLMGSSEISDELARAIVDRIEESDTKDPSLASAYRRMILKWQNAAICILLLRDVKRDTADVDTVVRLLSQRKGLREQLPGDVADLRNGKPTAVGIASCLFEDERDQANILENADPETKTAVLACARLIRAPLPIAKVAENLKSQNQLLQIAAERYLVAEDSPEARGIVLARHPNEAMILGATSAFYVEKASNEVGNYLWMLYQSVGDESLYNGWGESSNDDELEKTEQQLQAEVKKDGDLVGVYAYDSSYIRIYKNRVIFSWDEDESRYRERPLTENEFNEIKSYLTANQVDELAPFLTCGGDYCAAKEVLMLGRNGGRRIYTNGAGYPRDRQSDSEFFAGLDRYFADLKKTPATLKYALSREIPGLEIILASDDLHVETVWKDGNDLRVAASLAPVRARVKKDIDKAVETAESEEASTDDAEEKNPDELRAQLARDHEYDGFGWHKVVDGADGGAAAQPPGFEFIPVKDWQPVQPTEEQWKARVGATEVRADDEGLYLVSRGHTTLLQKGNFGYAVMSPNGRWVVAAQFDAADARNRLLRINLVTRKVYPVRFEDYQPKEAAAFVPILNKFLIVPQVGYYEDEDYSADAENGPDDTVAEDVDPDSMWLLDPETGTVQKGKNEFRPLSQQTFRPLQKASKPNEYWAALPGKEKNETQVGIYDAKWLTFRPVMLVPKIKFNSMSMWVDEAGAKVYFVYRGHLLALLLGKQK